MPRSLWLLHVIALIVPILRLLLLLLRLRWRWPAPLGWLLLSPLRASVVIPLLLGLSSVTGLRIFVVTIVPAVLIISVLIVAVIVILLVVLLVVACMLLLSLRRIPLVVVLLLLLLSLLSRLRAPVVSLLVRHGKAGRYRLSVEQSHAHWAHLWVVPADRAPQPWGPAVFKPELGRACFLSRNKRLMELEARVSSWLQGCAVLVRGPNLKDDVDGRREDSAGLTMQVITEGFTGSEQRGDSLCGALEAGFRRHWCYGCA